MRLHSVPQSKGEHRKRSGMRGRVVGGKEAAVAQAARWEGPTAVATGRARAERTRNMYCMLVTLDVSRLSGWLNAVADCRVEREAYEEERHAGRVAGGQEAAVAQAARWEGPTAVVLAGRAREGRT
eukprot:scaffold103039_cov45-Phaeocystis_antarctica.AAC.2